MDYQISTKITSNSTISRKNLRGPSWIPYLQISTIHCVHSTPRLLLPGPKWLLSFRLEADRSSQHSGTRRSSAGGCPGAEEEQEKHKPESGMMSEELGGDIVAGTRASAGAWGLRCPSKNVWKDKASGAQGSILSPCKKGWNKPVTSQQKRLCPGIQSTWQFHSMPSCITILGRWALGGWTLHPVEILQQICLNFDLPFMHKVCEN